MQYITVEGRSGSGKSVLCEALIAKRKYALVRGPSDLWQQWRYDLGPVPDYQRKAMRAITSVTESKYKIFKTGVNHKRMVVDSMFGFFIDSPPKLWDDMIDYVEMTLKDLLPTVTFAIDLPMSVCNYRSLRRAVAHPNVKIELTNNKPDIESGIPFFHQMAKRLDFVHIIDGMQSADRVFNDVDTILEGIAP